MDAKLEGLTRAYGPGRACDVCGISRPENFLLGLLFPFSFLDLDTEFVEADVHNFGTISALWSNLSLGSSVQCSPISKHAKRVVSKRVVLADVPPERKSERGYIRILAQNENRNEGTFACSPRTKTGMRVRSPKPPFYKTALLSPSDYYDMIEFVPEEELTGKGGQKGEGNLRGRFCWLASMSRERSKSPQPINSFS